MKATTIVLPVGARIADFLTAPHPAQWFVDHGFAGVAPYIKAMTAAQVDEWHAAGLAVIPIHENSRTESLGGAPAAEKYGPRSRAKLDALGHPADALVSIVAQDTGAGYGPASYATVRRYFERIVPIIGRPAADYGGTTLGHYACDGITEGTWRAAARSWSAKFPERALALQSLQIDGYDPNVILQPIRAWLPHEVAAPPTIHPPTYCGPAAAATGGDTMLEFVALTEDGKNPVDGVRWVSNGQTRTTPTFEYASWLIVTPAEDGSKRIANDLDHPVLLTAQQLAGLPLVTAS